MNGKKTLAILLIVVGVLSLTYTSFTFTKKSDEVNLGPIGVSVNEKQTVQIPIWASAGAIVIGGLLLVF